MNLAPSDVLEALNRLLDDNRELFITETQETVKPHPHFMLFATQNPPGMYGGRKVLSRAFRNRFVEVHFDEIPGEELQIILEKRCSMAPSHSKILIELMKELQRNRQKSKVFAGKDGFITLRDLFRWAERQPIDKMDIAEEGYMLLAERLRNSSEKLIVQNAIEKHLKVKLDFDKMYSLGEKYAHKWTEIEKNLQLMMEDNKIQGLQKIVWTDSMKRLYTLVEKCLKFKEPILLVGETGCAKTTVCQIVAAINSMELEILNCHQHTETSDFLGGLRPIRGKDAIGQQLTSKILQFYSLYGKSSFKVPVEQSPNQNLSPKESLIIFESFWKKLESSFNKRKREEEEEEIVEKQKKGTKEEISHSHLKKEAQEIIFLKQQFETLFSWHDGPLVHCMKEGKAFLIDEISLAEDAVLERLNSVLERSRMLTLAEKGGVEIEELTASENFRFLATMNPGGDFGKKELSPAMRNRFTEIWVPQIENKKDLIEIIESRLTTKSLQAFSEMILEFVFWYHKESATMNISLRDLLSWANFIETSVTVAKIDPLISFIHGASLVVIDGLEISTTFTPHFCKELRKKCIQKLSDIVPEHKKSLVEEQFKFKKKIDLFNPINLNNNQNENAFINKMEAKFGVDPFYIPLGENHLTKINFSLNAPTTLKNVIRVLRGLQLPKPILLEGDPGVGKK